MKINSQSNIILDDEIGKKNQLKKTESTRLICKTRNSSYETETTQ